MSILDYVIIFGYLIALIAIGYYFMRKQKSVDEYFVGDRKVGVGHIAFSVVATDVGGGFSIGLGGLGFVMGLSGSWLLFTGFIGAWLAAVLLIPKVKLLGDKYRLLTYPDYLEKRYDKRVRLIAALVSGIGYAGFVGGQILAGAKLSAAAFNIDLHLAVAIMATVVIIYTALGGLQAVIYTDTIQWFVLLLGLLLFALPITFFKVGGFEGIEQALPPSFFSLSNIDITKFLTWMFTIVPIWFVGMTLYQRIYATKDIKTAKRAWYIAGLLEWPLMAFLGVVLGMFARILYPTAEPEMGLPLLIKNILPIGIVGIVLAAYFSAIMSTADSCLLASVGNFVNDVYQKYINPNAKVKSVLWLSRVLTVVIGLSSILIALAMPSVLEIILLAYAFMVSGLFVPTIAGLISQKVHTKAALYSMITGGGAAIIFNLLPELNPFDDAILISLPISALILLLATFFLRDRPYEKEAKKKLDQARPKKGEMPKGSPKKQTVRHRMPKSVMVK